MPVRSVSGFFATVLGVCALVALGLDLLRPSHLPASADSLAGQAWLLRGWGVVAATLAVGVGVWIVGAGLDAWVGPRAVRVAAGLLVLASPLLAEAATVAYWDGRGMGTAWRADGRVGTSPSGTWRGMTGGACGYVSVLRVRLDAEGNGRGTAVSTYIGDALLTPLVALSPLDGPLAMPVRASLRDDTVRVWAAASSRWYRDGELVSELRVTWR